MQKFKIFISFFVLYEFVILTILQIPRYCVSVFNFDFCSDVTFKYFFMCVMLPILIAIFAWWIPNIARLFCNKTCKNSSHMPTETIRNVLHEIISKQDMERFITAAVIMGIQKFAKTHPKTKTAFDDILKIMKKTKK